MRSTPCGRVGFAFGVSPAATRSVQFAHSATARSGPSRVVTPTICPMAWPACRRRIQASRELAKWLLNSFGMVRVPGVPSAWHDMQPSDLTSASQYCWLRCPGLMPLPCGPVPGNSLFGGIRSIEYQKIGG